jgi:hypothetical protein
MTNIIHLSDDKETLPKLLQLFHNLYKIMLR